MTDRCPRCGGVAVLLQAKEEWRDFPDLSNPEGKVRLLAKIEEFRCQNTSCEHEFEEVVRERDES